MLPSNLRSFRPPSQNVIPQQLLDQYLSMTDPARAQTVDTEIAKHCAFSLPGVALTLGRQNWHCLKDTYETLATDVQVKLPLDDLYKVLSIVTLIILQLLNIHHDVFSISQSRCYSNYWSHSFVV